MGAAEGVREEQAIAEEADWGKLGPSDVGRRFRVWFESEAVEGQADFEYATLMEVNGAPGPDQELTIEWDGEGVERVRLGDLGRVSWLGEDVAADLAANLREHRQEALEGAEAANAEAVLMSVEHLRREVQAFGWLRRELAARAEEADTLRKRNAELRAQRAEFRERYPGLLPDEEGTDGTA